MPATGVVFLTNTAPTIIDTVYHARLLQGKEAVLSTAGVQSKYLFSSMKTECGEDEVDWVTNFRKYEAEGTLGLVLEGVVHPDRRCQAIAAALLRNHYDARVIPLNTLLG